MQSIRFTTSMGEAVINDVNSSHIGGAYRKLSLSEFEGNSQNLIVNSVKCIGMNGQRTTSTKRDTKAITAKIIFAPLYYEENRLICRGERGMHELRREILGLFPLGVRGTLQYSNDCGTYQIGARLDESPKITVRDGWFCECMLVFTADYPYWSKTLESETYTATAGSPVTFSSAECGDIESPVSGVITCSTAPSGEVNTAYFRLETEKGRIDFVRPMTEGQQLSFNLEFDNKLEIKTRYIGDNGYGEWKDAYEYLYYTESWKPCRNGTAPTTFKLSDLSETGELNIKLRYHNLFTAV